MKRFWLASLSALVALAATSCTDTRTLLAPDSARFSADASHTWQAGNGSAWHGYHAPAITYDAARTPFELCAQWSDPALFGRDHGRYADTEFFSFDFSQRPEGEDDWQRIGSANGRDREEAACYIVGPLDEGTYGFRVTGMARHGKGGATTTHHTTAWQANVAIGDVEQITFSVTIDPSLSDIEIDGSVQFAATVKDRDENEVENPTLAWTSDNENVAAVDGSGLVTATGSGYGSVKITATFSYGGTGYSGNATVTVRRPLPTVEISTPSDGAELTEGSPIGFAGSATDADGMPLTGGALVWVSSRDGALGTGESLTVAVLSVGEHEITLTATDAQGSEAAATVTITVRASSGGAPPILAETITAGAVFSCGLTEAGNAYCWGYNTWGQLGDGTTTDRYLPVAVQMPTGVSFTSISAGHSHVVALTSTGSAYAWGWNLYAQLGDGTMTERRVPVAVQMPSGVRFTFISAGAYHNVALDDNGTVYAWGSNNAGQIGHDPDWTEFVQLVPVAISLPTPHSISAVSAGGSHTVALATNGEAYAWGANASGQLGDGTDEYSPVPVAVQMPAGVSFTSISAGHSHVVALTSTGSAYAWGWNLYGQLGDGTTTERQLPVAVQMPAGVSFTSVSAGHSHVVALAPAGVLYAWGWNGYGQLGDGTYTSRSSPVAVQAPSGVDFSAVQASVYHTVALARDGGGYAWGRNDAGQLGDGTTTSRNAPTAVSGDITFRTP